MMDEIRPKFLTFVLIGRDLVTKAAATRFWTVFGGNAAVVTTTIKYCTEQQCLHCHCDDHADEIRA